LNQKVFFAFFAFSFQQHVGVEFCFSKTFFQLKPFILTGAEITIAFAM